MTCKPRDPLLSAARLLLVLGKVFSLIVAVGALLAVPGVAIMRERVATALGHAGAPPEVVWAIVTVLALMACGAVLSFFFLRHLQRIVDTVGEGDPFVPANAVRLQAMGWIVVIVQVLMIPLMGLVGWIEKVTDHVRYDFAMPLNGLLLAVVLFILARVFRKGTEMRDELEGTV